MSFLEAIHPESVLALGYAFFLLFVALGIEVVARFSHHRVRHSKTVGFRFDSDMRAWQCPQGNFLWLYEVDQQSQLIRYRAEARHCNRCDIKHSCTDSDDGRELTHSFEGWAESEMGRFHRGFCLMLIVLAGFILAVALMRHWHGTVEPAVLGVTALLAVLASLRVWERLRVHELPPLTGLTAPANTREPFHIVRNFPNRS